MESTFSSSITLSRQCMVQARDGVVQYRIHYRKEGCEGEYREDHDHRGALHLLAVGPCHAFHLQLQLVEIIARARGPTGYGLNKIAAFHATSLPNSALCQIGLAGAEGFEPPLAVLET